MPDSAYREWLFCVKVLFPTHFKAVRLLFCEFMHLFVIRSRTKFRSRDVLLLGLLTYLQVNVCYSVAVSSPSVIVCAHVDSLPMELFSLVAVSR